MADRPRPPRLARLLVAMMVRDPVREFLLGDLDEQFNHTAATAGPVRAWRRYWSQALRSVWSARSIQRPTHASVPASRVDVSAWWRDIRLGARTALRSPGYSLVIMLTLALAIGANTLLFSIANPLLVRALPIREPETLGWIIASNPERDIERGRSSVPDFIEWREAMRSFQSLAAYEMRAGTLSGLGDATRINTARATANLFEVWGLTMAAGRPLQAGENEPGRALVGVLSYRFWQEKFQGGSSVLGTSYFLDGKPIAIVGVMPKSIELGNLSTIDIWVPLPLDRSSPRDVRRLRVVGRLAPDATLESAEAELQPLVAAQIAAHPATHTGWQAHVHSNTAALASADLWTTLALLGVVVVFVLLIACANLANLVLARLVARRRESAVRVAIGASRMQLVRPLLVESLILSLAGGLVGLAVAYGGLRIITASAYEPFMRALEIDDNVLLFNLALSLLTPLLFTLWPAVSAGRAAAREALHGSRTTAGVGAWRYRNILVGGQIALALALLVVSALAVQTMIHFSRIQLGFDGRPILTYRFDLPADRYPDGIAHAAFARALEAELAAIPGATGAALMTQMPVIDPEEPRPLSSTRRDGQRDEEQPWALRFAVTPGYFSAMGITVLAGRTIAPADRDGAQRVAVLNRMAAERYFGSIDRAVGQVTTIHEPTGPVQTAVMGVVSDTRDGQVTRSSPQVYVAFDQAPASSVRVVVRSEDPAARARDVHAVMRRLDPAIAVSELKPFTQIVDEEMSSSRVINGLFVSFAGLALALAATGLFGVISYSVGQRRREIGIRLALGASPMGIGRMIVAEGLTVVGISVMVGLVLAVFLARASESLLFGITARDPATFGAVVVVIVFVALVAIWGPAARAMRVDPVRTLRTE